MKTRSITEGAMLAAITVLLTINGEYTRLQALIISSLALLSFRHGYSGDHQSFASAVVASLIMVMFSGVTIVIWGFLGIALAWRCREFLVCQDTWGGDCSEPGQPRAAGGFLFADLWDQPFSGLRQPHHRCVRADRFPLPVHGRSQ